jgi:hypothetical protein
VFKSRKGGTEAEGEQYAGGEASAKHENYIYFIIISISFTTLSFLVHAEL